MKTSQNGVNLIKSFEGCVLHAYKPVSTEKYFTIGYGHYGADVKKDAKITQLRAEELLKEDLKRFELAVDKLVTVTLNQNQFDSLVSFTYNCGQGALKTSTLLKLVNVSKFKEASSEFDLWVHASGVRLTGLVRRRKAEKELFLKAIPKPKATTQNYTIRSGEVLSKIAKRMDTTVSILMKLNPKIKHKDVIKAGQVIKVPVK